MTYLQLLVEFLACKFPWWGVFHISFEHETKTVCIYSKNPSKRAFILRDTLDVARLDIGVEQFMVVQPGYSEIMITSNVYKDFRS
ncbi:hypothetical protein [Brunnivagina elsteri]|uniref:Uncharacterized protein n=1 Tax=Brunnivagina elsteri CCALA 953 TaxID=987040 RepID=A0A2A2TET4_9CYAN|nr:hypothetical protein [Calothrix elsteri]PAX52145.1 hypothetical protein CK510_20865 [Calothrix elsteri CCALA 953]